MAGRVRQPIDVKALEAYVAKTVPEIKVPLDVKQFGFGQSNPTYQLTASDGNRYVLRKKPPGKLVSKTAHKVEREYRIIAALAGTDVPVPRAYCLCEDSGVIGTPFYIMSFLDGRIFEDATMPGVSPAERRAIWSDAARTLAKLHRVDFAALGLQSFGKATGFYQRQLATWKTICEAQARTEDVETGEQVGQLPHFAGLMRYFADAARQPADQGTIVHGDYKIDNLVFHKTEPRVIGILDWEMSTIGHPLSDLANFLMPFHLATQDPSAITNASRGFLPGATPGMPTVDEVAALYFSVADQGTSTSAAKVDAAGTRARALQWAQAFGIFRLAAICQGIAARMALRQASSEKAKQHAVARGPLAEFAWHMVEQVQQEGSGAEKPRL